MSVKHENEAHIRELLASALEQRIPVTPDLEGDYGFVQPPPGQTTVSYMELFIMQLVRKACAGSDKATTEVLDRYAGKPTQVTENLHANVSYTDYLDSIRNEEESPRVPTRKRIKIVDVVVANDRIVSVEDMVLQELLS